MKKLLVLAVAVAMMGCVSTGSGKVARELAPVGVIGLTSNDIIFWYGEKQQSGGLLGNAINKKVSEGLGQDVNGLLVMAEGTLREKLAVNSVAFIKPEIIQQADAYKKVKEDAALKLAGLICAPGYKYVTAQSKGLAADLAAALGIKTGIFVYFEFTKLMSSGVAKNGIACAAVTLNTVMVDEKGKQVSQKSYYAKSKDSFPIVAGIYKPEDLMKLYPDAINGACDLFIAGIKK